MFKACILILTAFTISVVSNNASATSKNNYGSVIVQKVTSIYDADTFRADIKGWPPIVGKNMSIRVNGVDAPEMRGKCKTEKERARQAKFFTIKALRNAKTIELRNMRRGKYFRILADVYVDGRNLSTLLINTGLARPYEGGKRDSWCRF